MRGWLFIYLLCLCCPAFSQQKTTRSIISSFSKIDSNLRQEWKNQVSTGPGLPKPFISAFPKAPFMFYWDTYFINKGLIAINKLEVAKDNVFDILTVVDNFGYMGNAAITTWGMNRSQPPYLSSMIMDVFRKTNDTTLLNRAYPVLRREYSFWTDTSGTAIESHVTNIKGLQRFGNHASRADLVILYKELKSRFRWTDVGNDSARASKALPYATEAESGMDFTARFNQHCPDYIAVDLNTLLYKMEMDLEDISHILKLKGQPEWKELAERRKILLNKYCWDEKKGFYFDYNFKTSQRSQVASLASFQPLWAGMSSKHQAAKIRLNLPAFFTDYGLRTTADPHTKFPYQWGYSSVWAPMQLIAVEGLSNYGYKADARKIAYRFLTLVKQNYDQPKSSLNHKIEGRTVGKTYEKYKAGGTINDDEYQANVMMGWTAGVFNYLYNFLISSPQARQDASGQLGIYRK